MKKICLLLVLVLLAGCSIGDKVYRGEGGETSSNLVEAGDSYESTSTSVTTKVDEELNLIKRGGTSGISDF